MIPVQPRMMASAPRAHVFVDQAVVFGQAFPAHAPNQADDLLRIRRFAG
jgi:hypothetical protein